MILVDSNVLIAAAVATHIHHAQSRRFLETAPRAELGVTASSLCEIYNNLTRPPPRFGMPPKQASEIVAAYASGLTVLAMDVGETIAALRNFAARGGTGPRLYDYLIGATGEAFGASVVVTWNVRHFDGLFLRLRIVDPAAFTALPGE